MSAENDDDYHPLPEGCEEAAVLQRNVQCGGIDWRNYWEWKTMKPTKYEWKPKQTTSEWQVANDLRHQGEKITTQDKVMTEHGRRIHPDITIHRPDGEKYAVEVGDPISQGRIRKLLDAGYAGVIRVSDDEPERAHKIRKQVDQMERTRRY